MFSSQRLAADDLPYIKSTLWITEDLDAISAIAGDATGLVVAADPFLIGSISIIDGVPTSGPWTIVTIPSPDSFSLWGHGVGRSGGRVAIGAPARLVNGQPVGGVTILEQNERGVWTTTHELLGNTPGEFFGWSVALDGTTLAVGCPYATVNGLPVAGLVRIFAWNGATWQLQQTITSDIPSAMERFGESLALRGDSLAIGGIGSHRAGPSDSGAAWLFERNGRGEFTLELLLLSPQPGEGDQLGTSVDALPNMIAAGAPFADLTAFNSGGVVLAERGAEGVWFSAILARPATSANARLGATVLVGEDRVVATQRSTSSAPLADFHRSRGGWQLAAQSWTNPAICRYGTRVAAQAPFYGSLLVLPIDLTCRPPSAGEDCNNNFLNDVCEITDGTVIDGNSDGVPDECPLQRVEIDLGSISSGGDLLLTAHLASEGKRVAIFPFEPGEGSGCPQWIDFAAIGPGGVATPIPVGCGGYTSAASLVVGHDWLALGAPGSDPHVSFVDVQDDGTLTKIAEFTEPEASSYFGWAVAGTDSAPRKRSAERADAHVFVGSPSWNDQTTSYPIRRFDRTAGVWSEGKPVVLADPGPENGVALAVDANTTGSGPALRLAISDRTPADDRSVAGRIRILELAADGSVLNEAVLRSPSPGPTSLDFGAHLVFSGDRLITTLAVGTNTPRTIFRGLVYRCVASNDWELEAVLDPTAGQQAWSNFKNRSISVTGNRVAFSLVSGAIQIFSRASSGAWIQETPIEPGVAQWKFGSAASLHEDGTIDIIAYRTFPAPLQGELWLLDPFTDCDGDGVDDSAQINAGAPDENRNGILDACEVPGDLDLDGIVGPLDLAILLGRFGQGPGLGDLNDDGAVDSNDLAIVIGGWS